MFQRKLLSLNLNKYNKFGQYFTKSNFFKIRSNKFSDLTTERSYGGLKDQDRIFTNVYRDGDPFIDGSLMRVN